MVIVNVCTYNGVRDPCDVAD